MFVPPPEAPRAAPRNRSAILAIFSALSLCLIAATVRAHPPLLDSDAARVDAAPDDAVPERGINSPVYVLDPITPTAIGVHINMPVVRGEVNGWNEFAATVRRARQSGLYLLFNNIDGPRSGPKMLAQTFDAWPYHDLINLVSTLAGSRVPILLYVGPYESVEDPLVVNVDRLMKWWNDAAWISQITGAPCGIVIDGSVLYTPGGAPDGSTPFAWFSMFAQALAPFNMEVGFESFRRHPNGTPYEDRRHYALLQYIVSRYATIPESEDADARIMSAIDRIPAAQAPLRNTVWLNNVPWDELSDGDPVPAEWLEAWGLTSPAQLQSAVVQRLYAKGYGLIFPREAIDP